MKINGLSITRNIMLPLNLAAIVGLAYFSVYSTAYITEHGLAKSYIQLLGYIPDFTAAAVFVITICVICIYALNILIRSSFNLSSRTVTLSCVLDVLLSVLLMYLTNFNYKGVLFMSSVFMYQTLSNKRKVFIFTAVYTLLYILSEYEFAAGVLNLVSADVYIRFLPNGSQASFTALRNMMASINTVLFLIYMIFWVESSKDETTLIRSLYESQHKTNEELKLINVQLEQYIEKSEESAMIRERNRVANEIHDTVGHSLTSLWAGINAVRELLTKDPDKADAQLEKLSSISQESLRNIRRSVHELRADDLLQFSLSDALAKLCSDITQVTNTTVRFNCVNELSIKAFAEDIIYRAVQESITNSVKHGSATLIEITMSATENGVFLYITDNGCGSDIIRPNTGISNIRKNISQLGGTVEFDGTNGFTTKIYVPSDEVSL